MSIESKLAHGPFSLPDHYNMADDFVDRHLRDGRTGKIAIIYNGERLTYGHVAAQANRVGNGLIRLGLRAEQRVIVVLPDSPEFVAAFFGAIKIGAVAVPTSTVLRSAEYDDVLTTTQPWIAVIHASVYPELAPVLERQKSIRHVIVCGGSVEGCLNWDEWLQACSCDLAVTSTRKDDVAFWLWTSGTSGKPNAAVHLHKDWAHSCRGYALGVLGISDRDVCFSSSKLFHAYGLGNGLMFPFYVGATTILYPLRPEPKAVLGIVQAERPTLFFSVPTLYAAMLQKADCQDFSLDGVRLAISAGEALPPEIFRKWKDRFGIEILDGIGSTEVLHIYISARSGKVRPGSTGEAVPGYTIRIVDKDNNDVPPGRMGDLIVSGESLAPCYWNNQPLSSERMRGRWFFTGDKYWADVDGYHWYAGRSDDMFRVAGQWVSPIEVENALVEHPCVLEAAVIAFTEENLLTTPKAFVVLRNGMTGSLELAHELQGFVKRRITPYKYPRRIEFVSELPKSATGKLLRCKLRTHANDAC